LVEYILQQHFIVVFNGMQFRLGSWHI